MNIETIKRELEGYSRISGIILNYSPTGIGYSTEVEPKKTGYLVTMGPYTVEYWRHYQTGLIQEETKVRKYGNEVQGLTLEDKYEIYTFVREMYGL